MLKILKSMKNQNNKGILIAIAMLMTLWVQGLKAQSKEDSLKIKKLFERENIIFQYVLTPNDEVPFLKIKTLDSMLTNKKTVSRDSSKDVVSTHSFGGKADVIKTPKDTFYFRFKNDSLPDFFKQDIAIGKKVPNREYQHGYLEYVFYDAEDFFKDYMQEFVINYEIMGDTVNLEPIKFMRSRSPVIFKMQRDKFKCKRTCDQRTNLLHFEATCPTLLEYYFNIDNIHVVFYKEATFVIKFKMNTRIGKYNIEDVSISKLRHVIK
jgi:hypothetical protein